MNETLLSAGIDVGTTTTHLIVSRIGICVSQSFGSAPKAEITEKAILYRSPVFRTPLTAEGLIDGKAVARIVENAYREAGVTPDMLNSGAVIITGESALKRNAPAVLHALAAHAGNFVSASAGSELESYLAGKGAGADVISLETGKTVANVDLGGGTANIALFRDGERIADSCLNLGGRMICENENGTLSMTATARALCAEHNITVRDFISPESVREIERFCNVCARLVSGALGLIKLPASALDAVTLDHPMTCGILPEHVILSGGVAECMGIQTPDFRYRDIGVYFAKALERTLNETGVDWACVPDAIRATVIGAGHYSMEVSGATIGYENLHFPLKNLECVTRFETINGDRPVALCPPYEQAPDFAELGKLARALAEAALQHNLRPLVVVVRPDFSKALAAYLKSLLPAGYPLLCIDGVSCKAGDYIDVGHPVANGAAVPVTVKTLVFGGKR